MSKHSHLRVHVLVEDIRTRNFMRHLLVDLGFEKRDIRFSVAPSGQGAAEKWVLERYVREVRVIRSKNYQKSLRLIAVRDGDGVGSSRRKSEFDHVLESERPPQLARAVDEAIALLVPTWSIETWLLALLGEPDINETDSMKCRFEQRSSDRTDLRTAAHAWRGLLGQALPSLADARTEMLRIA